MNPGTVSNYRKAFQPSRAKSDPIDARILVELLQKHQDKIPAWQAESPQMRALRQWVESRRMLVGEKVRLTNRLTSVLKNYYPQVLDWFEDKDTQVFCEFLECYPTLKAAQAATKEELTQFFQNHRVIRPWAQAYYRMQRAKGNSHPAAMRSLALKWVRILFCCWKNHEAYDEAKYIEALRRKGSPITKLLSASFNQ